MIRRRLSVLNEYLESHCWPVLAVAMVGVCVSQFPTGRTHLHHSPGRGEETDNSLQHQHLPGGNPGIININRTFAMTFFN